VKKKKEGDYFDPENHFDQTHARVPWSTSRPPPPQMVTFSGKTKHHVKLTTLPGGSSFFIDQTHTCTVQP
jgi:hypothetical protein